MLNVVVFPKPLNSSELLVLLYGLLSLTGGHAVESGACSCLITVRSLTPVLVVTSGGVSDGVTVQQHKTS